MSDKSKNDGKKARTFDLDQMFGEAKMVAEQRRHESDANRAEEEAKRAIIDEEGGDVSDSSNRLKISCSIDAAKDTRDMPPPSTSGADVESDVGPSLPPAVSQDSGLDNIEYDDFETASVKELVPCGWEAVVHVGKKPISALGVDNQGTRFMAGTYDYKVKMYDFPSMDSGLRPKRELEPAGCYIITSCSYAANGETLLITTTDKHSLLFNRDGQPTMECVAGDQYLVDKKNTKGHTSAITDAVWHPFDKKQFLTCSEDGTVRLWCTDDYKEVTKRINEQRKFIRVKTHGGMRAAPRCCAFTFDAKWIAAGCDDGSVQMWKNGKIFVNPHKLIRNAHSAAITSFAFSNDNKWLLTRGMDDAMKLWSMDDLKTPVHVKKDLNCMFAMTSCVWSPHDELCVTGTAADSRSGLEGRLVFLDSASFEIVYEVKYGDASPIKLHWHKKINQLFVGMSDGRVIIYYDEQRSMRGVMQCVHKAAKRSQKQEMVKEMCIIAPLTMEMFQPRGEEGEEKEVSGWRLRKLMYQKEQDPNKKFRKPSERPLPGGSAQGRVQEGGGSLIGHILRGVGLARNRVLREGDDVRASILKHAEEAEANPQYNTMYKDTQPVPIFQDYTDENPPQESDELQPVHKKKKIVT